MSREQEAADQACDDGETIDGWRCTCGQFNVFAQDWCSYCGEYAERTDLGIERSDDNDEA